MNTYKVYKILKYIGWALLVPFVSCLAWQYTDFLFAVLVFIVSFFFVLVYEVVNMEWHMKKTIFSGMFGVVALVGVRVIWPNLPVVHPTIVIGAVVYGLIASTYAPKIWRFIRTPYFGQID